MLWLFTFIFNVCRWCWTTFQPVAALVHSCLCLIRSSHQRCSVRKGVLGNFAELTGKHLCQSLFFNKVAGLGLQSLQLYFWHRCFLVNFAKFQRTPLLQNTSWWLLLSYRKCATLTRKWNCNVELFWIVVSAFLQTEVFFYWNGYWMPFATWCSLTFGD